LQALKILITDRGFVVVWISEAFLLGIFFAFQALIQQIGLNAGYEDDAGIFGFIV